MRSKSRCLSDPALSTSGSGGRRHDRSVSLLLLLLLGVALSGAGLGGCALVGLHPEILRDGLPGTGTVVKIWETGTKVNDNPVVGMRLRVNAEDLEWEAETRALISILDIPQIQPGAVFCLRYDPADHSRIALADCPVRDPPPAN